MLYKYRRVSLSVIFFLYAAGLVCLTFGFMTEYWIVGPAANCDALGLFYNAALGLFYNTGNCRSVPDNVASVARLSFNLELAAICVVWFCTILALGTTCLHEDQIYMSVLGMSFGVLYPLSGLLAIAGCIVIEVNYSVGYSCIVSEIAGGAILLSYILLRIYDNKYIEYLKSRKSHKKRNHHKKTLAEVNEDQEDDSMAEIRKKMAKLKMSVLAEMGY